MQQYFQTVNAAKPGTAQITQTQLEDTRETRTLHRQTECTTGTRYNTREIRIEHQHSCCYSEILCEPIYKSTPLNIRISTEQSMPSPPTETCRDQQHDSLHVLNSDRHTRVQTTGNHYSQSDQINLPLAPESMALLMEASSPLPRSSASIRKHQPRNNCHLADTVELRKLRADMRKLQKVMAM